MIKRLIYVAIIFLPFVHCSTVNAEFNLQGKLIYTDGGRCIRSLNLSSPALSAELIYCGNESISIIGTLTTIDHNMLIFEECPVMGKAMVKKFSLADRREIPLFPGHTPLYLPEHKALFFHEISDNNRRLLLLYDFNDYKDIEEIAIQPAERQLPNGVKATTAKPIVPISADEVVFYGNNNQIWKYSLSNSKLKKIGIINSYPLVYRSKTDQLLCRGWDSSRTFWIDINTKKKTNFSRLDDAYGFVYIDEYDVLVYGKTKNQFLIGERNDIYLYTFINNEEVRIKKRSHIAAGVWIPAGGAGGTDPP